MSGRKKNQESDRRARIPLFLLNAGADPTLTNSDGKSAFDLGADNAIIRNSAYVRIWGMLNIHEWISSMFMVNEICLSNGVMD